MLYRPEEMASGPDCHDETPGLPNDVRPQVDHSGWDLNKSLRVGTGYAE
jgi:hypothetical protein